MRAVTIEFTDQEWDELARASQIYQATILAYVRGTALQDARGTLIAEDDAQERMLRRALNKQRIVDIRSRRRRFMPGSGFRDSKKVKDAMALRAERSARGIAR